jgi:hypothetical protein
LIEVPKRWSKYKLSPQLQANAIWDTSSEALKVPLTKKWQMAAAFASLPKASSPCYMPNRLLPEISDAWFYDFSFLFLPESILL